MTYQTKRVDELEIGDIILPGHMRVNKRSWKVVETEKFGSRFFVKIEVLGNDYPFISFGPPNSTITSDDAQRKIGEIIKLDCDAQHEFETT